MEPPDDSQDQHQALPEDRREPGRVREVLEASRMLLDVEGRTDGELTRLAFSGGA